MSRAQTSAPGTRREWGTPRGNLSGPKRVLSSPHGAGQRERARALVTGRGVWLSPHPSGPRIGDPASVGRIA